MISSEHRQQLSTRSELKKVFEATQYTLTMTTNQDFSFLLIEMYGPHKGFPLFSKRFGQGQKCLGERARSTLFKKMWKTFKQLCEIKRSKADQKLLFSEKWAYGKSWIIVGRGGEINFAWEDGNNQGSFQLPFQLEFHNPDDFIDPIDGDRDKNLKKGDAEVTQLTMFMKALQFFDSKCPNLACFEFNQSVVTFKGQDLDYTQLLGSQNIADKNSFTLTIKKMFENGITIGVISSTHLNNKQTSIDESRFVAYNRYSNEIQGNSRQKWIQIKGNYQFQEGDVITVTVDQEKGEISLNAEDKIIANHQADILKEKDLDWRPYILMSNQGDQIQNFSNCKRKKK